jgi:iron complex outermembrane receptor protein
VKIEDDVTVGTLGLAIKANENWRVLLRADQNYRFAKVDEFLQPALTSASTPIELKTQEGLSLETGAEWSHGGNTVKFVVYSLKLENEITYDPTAGLFGANINLDDTERKGFITSGYWKATQRLGFSASYTYTDAEVTSGFATGKYIPLVAEHSALLSTDYAISKSWQVYGEVVAVSDRVLGGDFDNTLSTLPGYGVLNIKAGYQVSDFTFSGRVNNVFNKKYSDVGQLGFDPNAGFAAAEAYYPSPEINFLLTAAWNFR